MDTQDIGKSVALSPTVTPPPTKNPGVTEALKSPSIRHRQMDVENWTEEDEFCMNLNTFASRPVGDIQQLNSGLHGKCAPPRGEQELVEFLRCTSHFYMLQERTLEKLAKHILRREYTPNERIVARGDAFQHVYLLLWGSVNVYIKANLRSTVNADGADGIGEKVETVKHVGSIERGGIFGLDACIFDELSRHTFVAGGKERVMVALIPKPILLTVLQNSTLVSQSVGRKLAEDMDVFSCFREFCMKVFSHDSVKNEYLPVWSILDSYLKIGNVIHIKQTSRELDIGAWTYAVRRLPENLTSTFCFDLVRALPPFLASRMREMARSVDQKGGEIAGNDVKYVKTRERRRCSWQLGMQGKTLVLLRDGFTDVLDFVTNMCIHILEANKLRGKIQGMVHPPAIDVLDEYLQHCDALGPEEKLEKTKGILSNMPLSVQEQSALLKMWGPQTLRNIYEVIMHREEYMLRVDPSVSRNFNTDPFHEWGLIMRAKVLSKFGLPPHSPLPTNLVVDIISSNTHCTKNLLCSFIRKYRDDIRKFALSKDSNLAGHWHTEEDMIYVATPGFLQLNPELNEEYQKSLMDAGITVMRDTAMTGLQCDIIPVGALDCSMIDPLLRQSLEEEPDGGCSGCKPSDVKHIIINMDFAFGAQAEGIMRTLISTFARRIRSVNVMGKAGALVGKRGDIQLASAVLLTKSSLIVDDPQDELRVVRHAEFTAERLRELAGPQVDVHEGHVLTVPGTMMQNVRLLRYYQTIWKCIGVEMEGSYFARAIREMHRAQITRPDLITRFAYYTSDLPLAGADTSAADAVTLSAPMKPQEGVPPLYAIARAIMEKTMRTDTWSPFSSCRPGSRVNSVSQLESLGG